MNSQQFLTAMDIQLWRSHRVLLGAKPRISFTTLQLFSAEQECCGYLLFDNTFCELKNVTHLLENILFTIGLKYSRTTTPTSIFQENNKILIMGEALAKTILPIKEGEVQQLSSTIKVVAHPMELLQQPLKKRQVWRDLQSWQSQ